MGQSQIITKEDANIIKPETATNIYLMKSTLELEDNSGNFYTTMPPGEWKDFFDQMVAEKGKGKKTISSNFTQPFLGHRYRCILASSVAGMGISMRRLLSTIPRFREDLNLDWRVIQQLTEGTGLTIFAGQMGSGKSTTMIATIDKMGRRQRGGLGTVEEPIEFIFPPGGVIQREVGTDVESFAEAIRDFVRQNRKTIMVGEIRDPETANAAILAASTGHSVFATLHADSVLDIVPRMQALVDSKYERILPGTLRGLWWQHVVRHGDPTRPPVPIYESLHVTAQVRSILEAGPERLQQLMSEMQRQGRKSMAQVAQEMISSRKLKKEEAHEWLYRRGRFNDGDR
jgi:twitching motility protein PilT